MRHVERRQTLPYTAEQLFDLVNDVDSYPKFLPWCRAARAVPEGPDTVIATLEVGIGGVRTSFTTRNTLARPRSIRMDLRAGPFRRLHGEWRFEPRAGDGTDVSLTVDFEVIPSPFNFVFSMMFEELARSQMSAFAARAAVVYGAEGKS